VRVPSARQSFCGQKNYIGGNPMSEDKENLRHAYEVMVFVYRHTPATARRVRTILTHSYPELLASYTRFSGHVSKAALEEASANGYRKGVFIREHHLRMQNTLTKWVKQGFIEHGYKAFEDKVMELSEIHITLKSENNKLISKSASYESLGIDLIHWKDIPSISRQVFHRILKGKVINLAEYPV
jgi:hypothetical protein